MVYSICGSEVYQYTLPVLNSNMFVLIRNNKALVIDPSVSEQARDLLESEQVSDVTVILTHEHLDHISGVNALRNWASENASERKCTVFCNEYCKDAVRDPKVSLAEFFFAMFINKSPEEIETAKNLFDRKYTCEADIGFCGSYELGWENLKLVLRETPGHSPGSICIEIYDGCNNLKAVATGDSLVQGNKVITRLPGGSKKSYQEVVRPYLESFPGDTLVLPGHGEISLMNDLMLG